MFAPGIPRCWHGGPMKMLLGLGVVWMVVFCVGFPLAMAAVLWRRRAVADDPMVGARDCATSSLAGFAVCGHAHNCFSNHVRHVAPPAI